MTAPDVLYVEMMIEDGFLLDMTGEAILDMEGNIISARGYWVSILDDVLSDFPIKIFQGQRDSGPGDRVADSGSISLRLDNSTNNSAGLVGYYSPNHASVRAGFGLGAKIRVGLEKDSVLNWISHGRIVTIEPSAGNLSEKFTDVVATDWMEIASRTNMPWLSLEDVYNKKDDEILQVILDGIDDAPEETDFDAGSYTYLYPLNDIDDGKTIIMTILQRLTVNGLGRIYVVGGTTSGEILKYLSKDTLTGGASIVATFDNDFEEMNPSLQAYRRAKRVNVSANGYADFFGAYVYALPSEIAITAGQTIRILCKYTSPASSSVGFAVRFSSVSGDGGDDLHVYCSYTVLKYGMQGIYVEFTNTGAVTGYMNAFDVYDSGNVLSKNIPNIYTVEDTSIPEAQGVTLDWDVPYQNTYAAAQEIGDLLFEWHGRDITEVKYLKFTPSLSAGNYDKMILCKPGTFVRVVDDVTGIDADMLAVGFELQIWNNGALMKELLYLSQTP